MKKIKTLIVFSLFSFLIASPKVLAYNATVSYPGGKQSTGVFYSAAGNSQKTEYRQRRYEITYGGKVYDAYCLDPDLHGAKLVTCSPYDGDAGIIWLLQQFKGISDNNLKLLTFRMYGVYKDLIKTTPSQVTLIKQSIIRFLETKDGTRNEFSQNPYDFLSGNTALIDQAYALASTARKMSSGGLDEASSGTINVGKKTVNGLTATYPLTSNATIKPEYVDFECENCTILNKQWSGTSGTITIATSECNKEYKLNIVYKKSETSAYICSNGQKNTQSFLMFGDGSDDEVKVPYPDKLSCDGENCCTEDPIEPGWIGGKVNNCCDDGGKSEAHEYDLDQLFCRDKDLQVDYYAPKCKTDYYVQEDTTLNEKYCKMFCTERVSVEIPGPITAVSGRYFQLTQTSHGTKSPYIEGFKRCRIRVQYDIWEEDYYQAVKKQIKGYNDFQYNEAYKKMYEDAIKKGKVANQTETSTISCKAECTVQYEDSSDTSCNGQPCKKTDTPSDSKTEDCTIRFNRYNFNWMYDYFYVKLDEAKREKFTEYEIIKNGGGKTSHRDWSSWEIDDSIKACDNRVQALKTSVTLSSHGESCTATYECSRNTTTAESKREDVHSVKSSYEGRANAANAAYNAAASEAKQLEEDIDRCDYYFTKYEGADAESNYSFNAAMEFSYTQVYLDNEKGLQIDEQYIDFEDEPGCVISGPTPGPDGEDKLADKRYSNKYKTGKEKLVDFAEKKLEHEKTNTGYEKYRDTQYDADKLFTHDAKYRAECSWNEGENVYYTLSPNGFVSEGTDFINFTEHGQEYKLHLTTLDGTYETHWKIVGLGSTDKNSGKGKFDDFFMSQGQTCANESPSETSMFTCKIHVEYEIVLTGYCNGSNGTDTTVNTADCDPYKEGYNLFTFKVVDEANLFPNGFKTEDNKEIGHNWNEGDGPKILKEIEERGAATKTYDRENLTYSFILSPTDMGHIKNYNVQANAYGGYSDFNLKCELKDGARQQCKSIFLEELAKGNVTYDGQAHSVTGWNNKQTTLDGVRRKNGW